MKELLLLRHAKSSWKNTAMPDHDRPLNKRGEGDAPRMGKLLRKRALLPDLVLCSSAVRARETLSRVSLNSGFAGAVRECPDLYHKESADWFALLHEVPDDVRRLLLVGHNPGLEAFIETLTGNLEVMPTASLAHLELDIDSWQELNPNTSAELLDIWRPREFD